MGTIADKLLYLNETKTDLRATLNGLLGLSLDADTPFRRYAYEADMAAIRAMFASGELGGYWEPTLETLYETSAGTVPASVNGVVGCWDNLIRKGVETKYSIANSSFDSDVSGWTKGSAVGMTYEDGQMKITGAGSIAYDGSYHIYPTVRPSSASLYGKRYRLSFDATCVSGGNLYAGSSYDSSITVSAAQNAGVKQRYTANGVHSHLYYAKTCTFGADAGAVWLIDNVECFEIGAENAIQATTANKPYLRKTPQTNRYWLDGNTETANLTATFPSSLGSSCTIARLDPELGVQWSESQTIGTTYNLITPFAYHGPMMIINRALTAAEKAVVARVMGRFMPELGPELVKNGTFDTDLRDWVLTGGQFEWANGGKARKIPGAAGSLVQYALAQAGAQLFGRVMVSDYVAGRARLYAGSGFAERAAAGRFSVAAIAGTTADRGIVLRGHDNTTSCMFDDASLKEIL